MTQIVVNSFSGVSPAKPARYLDSNQAQTANNCRPWSGALRPIMDTSNLSAFYKTGAITSIYRFGQNEVSDSNYWFHWLTDVDVVKGFINGDTSERTYFSGDGAPKVTDNSMATLSGDGVYPSTSYDLGVPVPTSAITALVTGTADAGANEEYRVYTYTFVNSWGEESVPYVLSPMPVSTQVKHKTGQSIDLTIPTLGSSGNYNVVSKRIYRSITGSNSSSYLFVAEIPLAQTTYTDSLNASDLNEELPSLEWDHPISDLKGFISLPGGVIAAFSGNDVYFSEPFRPFAWPSAYSQSVGYPIVGLGVIDTTLVILTEGKPTFMQGSHPSLMVMVEADISQACSSKKSIVSMNGMVYYASPDGLVALSPGGSYVVTFGFYDKVQWQVFKPSSIIGFIYDDQYIGFYDNGTTQGGFVFDNKRKEFTINDIYAIGGYTDLRNDNLYLIVGNQLEKWDSGSLKTYTWKSKLFTLQREIGFTCFQVRAESYPLTLKVYTNGLLFYTATVLSDDISRLPSGTSKNWEVELIGNTEVYSVKLAQTPSEINNG